ncbi:MAG: FecR domain-containing protein [Flavitalea sp.]
MDKETLLARLLEGDLSEAEKKKLEEDEDHDLYQKIAAYSQQLVVPDATEEQRILSDILSSSKEEARIIPFYKKSWFKVAASVLLVLTTGIAYLIHGDTRVISKAGSNINLHLPDQSEVTLSPNSGLAFNRSTWPFNRKLELSGEAYFSVEKGSLFTVHTSTGDVKVLGTKFNVDNRNGELKVECFEGRVEVSRGSASAIITAGQMATINGNGLNLESVYKAEPSWTRSSLIFRSVQLAGVIKEIEKNYQIKIDHTVGDDTVNKDFTGVMPSDNLNVAINIIEKAFSVKCTKISDQQYRLEH